MGVHRTRGEPDEVELTAMGWNCTARQVLLSDNTNASAVMAQFTNAINDAIGLEASFASFENVRAASRSPSPQWGSIRFRPLSRTCRGPTWGCVVRVDELSKSLK